MEVMNSYVKNIHSPLYDRRLAIIILRKYSHGRRSFSENARVTKIKEEHRNRHYEPEAKTFKERQNQKTETQEQLDPRMGYSDVTPF
jgi:predicted RNA-binding protein with RPS1 domain